MALKNIKDLFVGNDDEEIEEVEITEIGGLDQMMLVAPRAYSEAREIVKYLQKESTVVVNLKLLAEGAKNKDAARRIFDYLSGAVFAMDGNIKRISNGIFICAPKKMKLQGEIKDEKGREKTDEEDF